MHEVMFETAYVDFRRFFADGLSLRVGRQDISKGEGFLLFEGSPYDGSRTRYMNAAVLGYGGRKQRLELMAISNPQEDRYLPRIHDRHRMLIDWDETAVGAYYTDNRSRRTPFDLYYFLKKEFNDRRPASHPQYQPDRHLHTAGGRVVHDLRSGWSLTGDDPGTGQTWGCGRQKPVWRCRSGFARASPNIRAVRRAVAVQRAGVRRPGRDRDAGSGSSRAISAAIVSIPSQRFCRRMFSLGPWALPS